jgi:hypothetical protein
VISPNAKKPGQSKDAEKPNLHAYTPPNTIDATELMSMQLPEANWAVQGIIPEGLTLLAGRPKMGKSWLALHIAIQVANGEIVLNKFPANLGDVLYLALEDGLHRLQKRMLKLLGDLETIPANLEFATEWPLSNKGGLDAIDHWLQTSCDPALVVLDTLGRMKAKRPPGASIYEADYDALVPFKQLADKYHVAIKAITHIRKPSKNSEADDPLDEIMDSTGITGCADTVINLVRKRYSNDAKLCITGRDIDEQQIPILWQPDSCRWALDQSASADDPDKLLTANQRDIRKILLAHGKPMTPLDIAPKSKLSFDALNKQLQRMVEQGLAAKLGKGAYTHPDLINNPKSE